MGILGESLQIVRTVARSVQPLTQGWRIGLLGKKSFELSDHLGNVSLTVSDWKQKDGSSGYEAQVLSYEQYYPFGMKQKARSYSQNSYRFGFNGKENDSKEWGSSLIQDYGFRLYNPGIGKFLSIDPLRNEYPELTPYQFASNTPILAIDRDGLEAWFIHGTFVNSNWWNASNIVTRNSISNLFKHSRTGNTNFNWSGDNNSQARIDAGRDLAQLVNAQRVAGEQITLVGHSHGGNVAVVASHILISDFGIDPSDINLVLFNTPNRVRENTPIEINGRTIEHAFQPNEDVNTYSIEANRDAVKWGGEWYFNKTASSTFKNVDYTISFEDQYIGFTGIPSWTWTDIGMSNHVGPTDQNFGQWYPPLLRVITQSRSDLYEHANENGKINPEGIPNVTYPVQPSKEFDKFKGMSREELMQWVQDLQSK